MKPQFLIIGAAKCGTTYFSKILNQHSQIFIPVVTEPHFYDNDENYQLGFQHYLNTFFKDTQDVHKRGDCTPNYFHRHGKVIPRLLECNTKQSLQFILILRDPVKRAFSHYLHRVRVYKESESFEKAVDLEKHRLAENPDIWASYFQDGLYAQQLKHWFAVFEKDQFHIIFFEDMVSNIQTVAKQTFRFLHAKTDVELQTIGIKNKASVPKSSVCMQWLQKPMPIKNWFKPFVPKYTRKLIKERLIKLNLKEPNNIPALDPAMDRFLRSKYYPDIEALEKILDINLNSWKHP
ncbi:MAG: sulfotransferase domain-containing protein [Desulfohalobiaceae bacterium]|nr:sulfotransferase domain-containing protein [Desulfohalobiaceae bacterium]